MLGLVSLLPRPYYQQVEGIWEDLETKFNLVGFLVSPIPHFSWQIAEDYDQDLLTKSLAETIQSFQPFQVRTSGIGLFTGVRQVIYIPIIKDCHLIKIHDQIWQAVKPSAHEPSPLYSPDRWVPHITLFHENLTTENIGPVMKYLSSQSYNWEMTIDQISLVTDSVEDINALHVKASFDIQNQKN